MNLTWTKSKQKQYLKISRYHSKYKCGGACAYLKVGKSWGVKLYQSRHNRDFSFFNHYYASQYRLAPSIGSRFSIEHPDCYQLNPWWKTTDLYINSTLYGYVVQHVSIRRAGEKRVKLLKSALQDIGIYIEDIAIDNNVGFINNKIVCIDFDYWSVE